MDVLYILKSSPSNNGDEELRYSLRSLEKFCPDVDCVYITGGLPSFIKKDTVIHTPADDIGVPAVNHWHKVRQTIEKTNRSDDFVLMYDDVFFVRKTCFKDYPLYYKGVLPSVLDENSLYRQTLYNTRLCINNHKGKTFLDFGVHCPIVYNREAFMRMDGIFEEVKKEKPAYSVRSVYGNLFAPEGRRCFREDIKIRRSNERVEDVIGESDCFSVSDDVFSCDTLNYLKKSFPERSVFEK